MEYTDWIALGLMALGCILGPIPLVFFLIHFFRQPPAIQKRLVMTSGSAWRLLLGIGMVVAAIILWST